MTKVYKPEGSVLFSVLEVSAGLPKLNKDVGLSPVAKQLFLI